MSTNKVLLTIILTVIVLSKGDDDIDDFMFSSINPASRRSDEVDRSELDKVVKPIILKPKSDTNSHRPQFNVDSVEDFNPPNKNRLEKRIPARAASRLEILDPVSKKPTQKTYQVSNAFRAKENSIKAAVQQALKKKENVRGFSEVLPIMRTMSPSQKLTMASIVTSQLSRSDRDPGLSLNQVRSMFGNTPNATSELMLPIVLDIANMFRRGSRTQRASPFPPPDSSNLPKAEYLRRAVNPDDDADYGPEEINAKVELIHEPFKQENDDIGGGDDLRDYMIDDGDENIDYDENDVHVTTVFDDFSMKINPSEKEKPKSTTPSGLFKVSIVNETRSTTRIPSSVAFEVSLSGTNPTVTNSTTSEGGLRGNSSDSDLPVAEKLRALNRFVDRNGNVVIRRPPWSSKVRPAPPPPAANRRNILDPKKRYPTRKPPPELKGLVEMAKQNCELFTNTLCLETRDYPSDAILSSIRRNKSAATALLADFQEQSSSSVGSVDGVSAKQETNYTAEHYYNLNRREDGGNSIRDFAAAGEEGYMCPSMVKYARPQRARATSGLWKYIVNTGEHTQTLRLEKCLKPKEPCTYLTDNFKSKCVQVYNYHRLLTWDQQNGLHMDIFKVPTCCSCHIEGYSVSFPPLPGKQPETSSDRFPGEDISQEAESNPYEQIQPIDIHSSFPRPKSPNSETYTVFGDSSNNIIPGSGFQSNTFFEEESSNQHEVNHFTGTAFDTFPKATTTRNVKKPARGVHNSIASFDLSGSLPSYLEPPSKSAASTATTYYKTPDLSSKLKFPSNSLKRPSSKRPSRRPIRKKAGIPEQGDLLQGASNIQNPTIINMDSFDDINGSQGEVDMVSSAPMTKQKQYIPVTKFPSHPTKTEKVYHPFPNKSQREQGTAILKDITLNRRVNYNYHPIIDFFENGVRKEVDLEASDRADESNVFSQDSEWRPMSSPIALPQVAPSQQPTA